MEEKHPLNNFIRENRSRGYAAVGRPDLFARLNALAAVGQGGLASQYPHRPVIMLGGAGWGKVGALFADISLSDYLAAFGLPCAFRHDMASSVVLAALQGLVRFSVMRVSDGSESPAVLAMGGFSPAMARQVAWRIRGESAWLGAESDGATLIVSARCAGALGNDLSLHVAAEKMGAGTIVSVCLAGRVLETIVFPERMPLGCYSLSGGCDGAVGLNGRVLQQAAWTLLSRDLVAPGAVVVLPGDVFCAGWSDLAAALAVRGAGLAAVLPFDRALPLSWAVDLADHLHEVGKGFSSLLWADDLYWNDPGGAGLGLVSPAGALAVAMAMGVESLPLRGILGPRHAMTGETGFETLGSGANGNEFEKVIPSHPGFRIITPDKSREIYCVKLT